VLAINPKALPEIEDQQLSQRSPGVQRHEHRWTDFMNVGPIERIVAGSAAIGLGLWSIFGRRKIVIPGLIGAAALAVRAASGYCPIYQALGINNTRRRGEAAQPEDYFDRSIHVDVAYTIDRPAEQLYAFWRNFENLPKFMRHLQSVHCTGGRTSHWVACGPAGFTVEWDAEIINEEPNALISWRSLANADVDNAGSVRFVPARSGRGTEVRVVLDYIPPAGRLGFAVAKLFGEEPRQQITEDLWRFKELMEAGEIPSGT